MNSFHKTIASGFGAGFCPVAPGTAGALLATLVWIGLGFLTPYLFEVTIALVIVFTVLGIWSSNVLEPEWGKDPARIVVDEMVGVWIPLLVVDASQPYYYAYTLAAFVLFRLFDIFKPLGIRRLEKLPGGWGVMMDDIVAGIYSLIVLWGVMRLVG